MDLTKRFEVIVPGPGVAADVARELLAVAPHPHDVKWVTWPRTGFRVNQEIGRRWSLARQGLPFDQKPEVTP